MESVRVIIHGNDLVNIREQYISQRKHPEYGPESRSTARSTGVPPEYRSISRSTGVRKGITESMTVTL